ncbi:MAG: DUF554 domain-containing protein [Nitriliruptor sp.]|uniref:DUF554 domain-containing protein n=1 Tax=Nitriliruptor sp. TaxID=2448056 RepID=UPI0034A046CB
MLGTLLNGGAIVVGALAGSLLGDRLPTRVRTGTTDVVGVFVLVLGVSDALETFSPELRAAVGPAAVLVVLGALVLGGMLGELVDIEARLAWVGERLRDRVLGAPPGGEFELAPEPSGPDRDVLEHPLGASDPRHRFVEGFVITTMIVCVGPLAIIGSLQDGLSGDIELLAVKAVLDGSIALAFASALGIGVAFAALPLLVLQGTITLAAAAIAPALTEPMLLALTATGGVLVAALGLRLLEVRAVRVANLLPALVLAPVAASLLS